MPQRVASLQIAIGAGKGGVGKSILTAQISSFLAAKGFRVGVLDADLYGPSQPTMLKVDRPAGMHKKEGVELITPARSQGISYVSLGLFRPDGSAVAARAPIVTGMIQRFLHQVQWGDLDFLLIDLPPGTGDIQLSLAQQMSCDAACLVSTPGKVCLEDVRRCADLFSQLQIPLMGYVLNMAYIEISGQREHPFGKCDPQLWDSMLHTKCLAQIPLDPNLSALANEGVTLASYYKEGTKSKTATLFCELAEQFERLLKDKGANGTKGSNGELGENQFLLKKDDYSHEPKEFSSHPFLKMVKLIEGNILQIQSLDGRFTQWDLAKLLELCPCASCSMSKEKSKGFSLLGVESVGNYGVRIVNKGGCSLGIFPLEDLFNDQRYQSALTSLESSKEKDAHVPI